MNNSVFNKSLLVVIFLLVLICIAIGYKGDRDRATKEQDRLAQIKSQTFVCDGHGRAFNKGDVVDYIDYIQSVRGSPSKLYYQNASGKGMVECSKVSYKEQ